MRIGRFLLIAAAIVFVIGVHDSPPMAWMKHFMMSLVDKQARHESPHWTNQVIGPLKVNLPCRLKLDSTKGPVEVLVIDTIEQPSED